MTEGRERTPCVEDIDDLHAEKAASSLVPGRHDEMRRIAIIARNCMVMPHGQGDVGAEGILDRRDQSGEIERRIHALAIDDAHGSGLFLAEKSRGRHRQGGAQFGTLGRELLAFPLVAACGAAMLCLREPRDRITQHNAMQSTTKASTKSAAM